MIKKLMENNFVKSTLILLTGGFLSKFLGFILKIIITREIGTEGIGLYSMMVPTFSFFTVLAIFSYPTAISSLVAEGKRSSKKLILSIIPVAMVFNILMIAAIIILAPFLSTTLLKEPRLYYPIICVGFTLPFVGLSSIIKGYFWGKQRMSPYIISNISEQIVRIIILVLLVPKLMDISVIAAICAVIVVNVISESVSIIVMIKSLPKNAKITKNDLKISKREVKDIMGISIPSTSSKVIGSLFYFLEPIILTNILLYLGYSKDFITMEYGIVNGYSLSLLLLPQFFTQSVSTALIPELSKNYSLGNKEKCKKRIKQIVLLSLLIGVTSTIIIYIFPEQLLSLLFHTTKGAQYIRVLAPFTLLYFVEIPLLNSLQALNKAKTCMKITLVGEIIRTISIVAFSFLKIGMYSLVIAIIINLITSTYMYYKNVRKIFT